MKSLTELSDGVKIYQFNEGYRFTVDSVLLSDFYSEKKDIKVLDIGTGNGIIPILLKLKGKVEKITGVEIQEQVADLAQENIELNNLNEDIRIVCGDIKLFSEKNSYDSVISNPPYMKIDGKLINPNSEKAISRHELLLNLKELVEVSKKLLKPRGSIYMVHRAHRLPEIIFELMKSDFSIERIKFVYHKKNSDSNLVLIKAQKGKKTLCAVEVPLYLEE